MTLKLPVGIEDFREIRCAGFYYVDKTKLIEQLLDNWGKVNLFTRPRRFGKTLNMSMLHRFFEIGADRSLFDGLNIMLREDLCNKYFGQFPVIFLTLKGVDGLSFEKATQKLINLIAREAERFRFLQDSDNLTENEKERYLALIRMDNGKYSMDEDILESSLQTLSELLFRHYGQKVIILIDEYDVPLDKAYQNGYYREMFSLIRSLFGDALKTNEFLQFSVLTGCLRVSKESIFTGLNNFKILSITDVRFDEQFGFTEAEVEKLLKDYHLESHLSEIKEWYNGYRFGDADIYCPWDVMNYLRDLRKNPKIKPASYWRNTSDNAIIRSIIDYAGENIHEKMETLLAGGYIIQKIREDLTYDYLHASEENLWSILYSTGYLTQVRGEELPPDTAALMIPNAEIRQIFETTVQEWFDDSARKENRTALFDAVWSGDIETLTEEMNELLRKTISYHDYKEDFYHAFLAGILAGTGCAVKSNREHGEGRSDVVVYNMEKRQVAIFEAKYAKTLDGLETSCDAALQQIEDRQYAKDFADDYDDILCYGIAFYKKRCLVRTM